MRSPHGNDLLLRLDRGYYWNKPLLQTIYRIARLRVTYYENRVAEQRVQE